MKALVILKNKTGDLSYSEVKDILTECGIKYIEVDSSTNINNQIRVRVNKVEGPIIVPSIPMPSAGAVDIVSAYPKPNENILSKSELIELHYSFTSLPKGKKEDIFIIDDVISKENTNMYDCDDCSANPTQYALYHFNDRLRTTKYAKDQELLVKFGMTTEGTPQTAAEAIQRIKSGKASIKKDGDKYNSWYSNIIWRDEKIEQDQAGYLAASKKLEEAFNFATDDLAIAETPKAMKDVLDTFAKKTVH